MIGIYYIKNKINNKYYIGQSIDISRRIRQHKHYKCKINKSIVYLAFEEYGISNFEFGTLEECGKEMLDDREIFWINSLNTTAPNGYNLYTGGTKKSNYSNGIKRRNNPVHHPNGTAPYCLCGCGKKTSWSKWSNNWNKYLMGHIKKLNKNYVGRKINRITIVKIENNIAHVFCECSPEIIFKTNIRNIIYNGVKSCGCLKTESRPNLSHGLRNTKLYQIFYEIKGNCYNPNRTSYKKYGGNGATICDEWLNDFSYFYNWAIDNGWEDGLVLSRIDESQNFNPANCKFITKSEMFSKCEIRNTNKTGYIGISKRENGTFVISIKHNGAKMLYKSGFLNAYDAAIERDNFIIENNLPHKLNFNQDNS